MRAIGHARWLALVSVIALTGCVGGVPVPPAPAAGPVATPAPPQPDPVLALDGAIRQGATVRGIAPVGTIALTLDGDALPFADDRRFVFGLDRDAPATALLVATLADGRRIERRLAVAPGGWRIEPVDAPLTAGRTSAEFARLRPAELAEIAAARRIDRAADGWRQRFVWPVIGRRSGLFGAQRVYRGAPGSFHSGADVAVPAGTPVRAPADGIVALATTRAFMLEGNLVILDHGMGLNSAFLHLSAIEVRPGQRVRQGDTIGRVGATGRATGPHMHWGMKWRAARVDPGAAGGGDALNTVSLDPEAQALLRRAAALFRARRMAEAAIAYEALLAITPALPDSWFNLAIAQRRLSRPDDALRSLEAALHHDIDHAEEAHLHRALVFAEDLRTPQAAHAALRDAIALAPEYIPAWLNLGNLYEDEGDRIAARQAYRRVLEIEPGQTLALARLAGVSDIVGITDPLIERLRNRLTDRTLDPLSQADLGFALGDALDRIGHYDSAFLAYAAANAVSRGAAGIYDPAAMETFVDRSIAAFPIGLSVDVPAHDGPSPIFVCGMYRSGSTLAERLLEQKGGFFAGGELAAIPSAIGRHLSPYPEAAATADAATLATIRQEYRDAVARFMPENVRATDKRPDNILHIGLIKRLFPDARIVHTVRNPLDTCLSIYFLHAGPALSYATDLREAAHYQRQVGRLMAHWTMLYPDAIHVLDYDRLVADQQRQITALLHFTGADSQRLDSKAASAPVRTASHWQVRKPLYQSSSGRWRNYRSHLAAAGLLEDVRATS